MRSALAVCLVSRAALVLFAWVGLVLAPPQIDAKHWQYFPDNLWADSWARWDSGWYHAIADEGYTDKPNDNGERDTSFFPLYPLCMRVASVLFDGDLMYGGLLVSNVAFLLAGLAIYGLARDKLGHAVALRGLALLCVFPFSLFLAAVYTEALFLACAAGAFFFGERRQWLPASLCASCAAATRIPGFLVGLGLAVLYWEKEGRLRTSVLYLALVPFLPGVHLFTLYQRFGDPLRFISSSQAWSGARLFRVLREFTQTEAFYQAVYGLEVALFAAACVLCVRVFRRLGKAYGLWCLAHLLVSLSAPFIGMGRHLSVLFPLFLVAAQAPARLCWAWACVSTVLLGLLTYGFSHWLPVQ